VDLRIRIGDNWFLDDEIPRHKLKKGYVRGQVESIRWEESRDGEAISMSEGLTMSMSMGRSWTIKIRAAMIGGELDKGGRAGWEEGKKYQGADQRHTGSTQMAG
jgi:hypothetical protein